MHNSCDSSGLSRELELVEAAQGGSAEALAELARTHYRSSLKVALSILRSREEAEDEVQNAYLKACQHIGRFQKVSRFSTWITRIVVNQCRMRLRQDRRSTFLYLDDAPAGENKRTLEIVDQHRTPEDDLGGRQVAAVLRNEIRRLPPLLRSVLVLRHLEGVSMDQVAERLGISIAAARARLLRARREARRRVARHCGRTGPAGLAAAGRSGRGLFTRASHAS